MTLTFIQYLLAEAIRSHVVARPDRTGYSSMVSDTDHKRPFFQQQLDQQNFNRGVLYQHRDTLQKYTDASDTHFENINIFLRHGDNPNHRDARHFRMYKDRYDTIVGHMDDVFKYHAKVSDKPMTVFRGIRGGYGFKPESHIDQGFLSTSVKSDIALLHAGRSRGQDPSIVLRIKVPAGTPHLVNPTRSLMHENEIVFPRGSYLNIHPRPHVTTHVKIDPYTSKANESHPLHVHDVILTHPKFP